uniref:Uncharacterized protein n=1 Tax=Arundo donax TaxID=35708 RepID=A0A0A9GG44_ARUDO
MMLPPVLVYMTKQCHKTYMCFHLSSNYINTTTAPSNIIKLNGAPNLR